MFLQIPIIPFRWTMFNLIKNRLFKSMFHLFKPFLSFTIMFYQIPCFFPKKSYDKKIDIFATVPSLHLKHFLSENEPRFFFDGLRRLPNKHGCSELRQEMRK